MRTLLGYMNLIQDKVFTFFNFCLQWQDNLIFNSINYQVSGAEVFASSCNSVSRSGFGFSSMKAGNGTSRLFSMVGGFCALLLGCVIIYVNFTIRDASGILCLYILLYDESIEVKIGNNDLFPYRSTVDGSLFRRG